MDEGSLSLPPFTGYDEKSQRDYHLALRGNSLNPMIDAATPLLGMVMRLSTMNSQTMPEHLFAQVVTDVQAVEQLLQEQGYEPGVIISFRYILCTFIDEAALGNGWSNKNEWIKQSLLVHFHNEAWGGEKVFILLERLIREPKRYQDLLEFLWLCFSLGFRGRYKVAAQDQGEFEQIYRRLYHVLHKLRGDAPFPLLHQDKKTQGGRYQLISRLTIKHIFCGGVVADHIQLLFRATNNVICCYDGDRAGRDAAWRALETALPYMTDGRQLRFMFLPDGEDPDTLVRKEGKEAFEARMEQSMPLSAFLFNSLMPQVDLSTPDGRARLSTLALPLISQVPGETLRIYLRQELGNKLGILDDSQLERLMPKAAESGVSRPVPQLKRTTMRILIGLLVQNPELATLVPPLENLDENKLPGLGLFRELVNTCLSQPGLTTGQLLEHYRGTNNAATLEKLSMWDDIADKNIAEQTFTDSLNHMFDSLLELRQEELIARERTHGLSNEERLELWTLNQELAKK